MKNKKVKLINKVEVIKTKIVVKPCYTVNKSSEDVFTEIIIRSIDKRKSEQLEDG